MSFFPVLRKFCSGSASRVLAGPHGCRATKKTASSSRHRQDKRLFLRPTVSMVGCSRLQCNPRCLVKPCVTSRVVKGIYTVCGCLCIPCRRVAYCEFASVMIAFLHPYIPCHLIILATYSLLLCNS